MIEYEQDTTGGATHPDIYRTINVNKPELENIISTFCEFWIGVHARKGYELGETEYNIILSNYVKGVMNGHR